MRQRRISHQQPVAVADMLLRPSYFGGHRLEQFLCPYEGDPRLFYWHLVKPRTVIKTYSLLLSTEFAEEYASWLQRMDGSGNGGMPGCTFCDPYCYDHALEWGLQGKHIISPVMARVTQRPGSGMTYKENEVRDIYSGFVGAANFSPCTCHRGNWRQDSCLLPLGRAQSTYPRAQQASRQSWHVSYPWVSCWHAFATAHVARHLDAAGGEGY